VAEWRSAETGVGPAIAANSHGENGSWADLAAAARSTPAAIISRAGLAAPPIASNANDPDAANVAPAAT
jgi:hypothetical protein